MPMDHKVRRFVDICCPLVQQVDLGAGHLTGRMSCIIETSFNGKTSCGGRASNAHDSDSINAARCQHPFRLSFGHHSGNRWALLRVQGQQQRIILHCGQVQQVLWECVLYRIRSLDSLICSWNHKRHPMPCLPALWEGSE